MGAADASALERLTATATLGTRRAPLPKESLWPDESLAPAGAEPVARETSLLRAAAAGALWERAGSRAAPAQAVPDDFPADERAALPEPAGWRLARILGGEYPYLLQEWFEAAAATGRVLPPHFLPLVLDHVEAGARAGFGGVLGPACVWLAARNPRWLVAPASVDSSDSHWQEGSLEERRLLLAAIRKLDHARSLAWLRSTWDTDAPEAREAFLAILVADVSADDESFLEAALDDKRKPVRQAAAEGLMRLPASAHAQRIVARLDPLIELEAPHGGILGKLRKRTLRVDLPAAPDKAALRDGMEAKVPASRKIGERAFWLSQLIAMVPPAHWSERFACDAQTFIGAALATDHSTELLGALTAAAARHPRGDWSQALARAWMAHPQDFAVVTQAIIELANGAPPADRAALIEQQLRDAKPENFGYISHVLDVVELRWNTSITTLALDHLATLVSGPQNKWAQARNCLDPWARRCDLAIAAPRAAVLLEKTGEGHSWRNALEQFNDIVAFRAAMHKELTP
jgi:hypothetical protein